MNYAVCPYCDELLVEDDIVDSEIDTTVALKTYGHCECCGSGFSYRQIYTFSYVEELEED